MHKHILLNDTVAGSIVETVVDDEHTSTITIKIHDTPVGNELLNILRNPNENTSFSISSLIDNVSDNVCTNSKWLTPPISTTCFTPYGNIREHIYSEILLRANELMTLSGLENALERTTVQFNHNTVIYANNQLLTLLEKYYGLLGKPTKYRVIINEQYKVQTEFVWESMVFINGRLSHTCEFKCNLTNGLLTTEVLKIKHTENNTIESHMKQTEIFMHYFQALPCNTIKCIQLFDSLRTNK